MQSFGFGMGEGHANLIQGDWDTDFYKPYELEDNEGPSTQIIEKIKKYPFCDVSTFVSKY